MLHHVTLEIPPADAERSIEFWGLLGFRHVEAPPEVAEYVDWVERDGTQIHLIHNPEPTVPVVGHTAVVAADFAETMRRLADAGFEVAETRQLWGEPRAVATAPAGHRVELMAAPPAPAA